MESSNTVTPFELAVLVLHYLESNGHKKTAQSFRREAKSVLGSAVVSLPAGVKNLQELLNEYVDSAERDSCRQALQAANPVAQSLFSLLDFHAGLPVSQTLPPAFYASAAPPPLHVVPAAGQPGPSLAAAQQQQVNQGLSQVMVPVQAADLSYTPQHAGLGPQLPQQQQMAVGQLPGAGPGQHTPGRHAHRKGAPKRRRAEEAGGGRGHGVGAAAEGGAGQHVLPIVSPPESAGAGGGGYQGLQALDLLNMPLDEEGLISLLCDDDLQVRFASGLAQHITTVINHQLPAAGSTGRGGEEHLVVASIDDVLAELPADPMMAELLQQFVRCDGGGSGSGGGPSLASLPDSSPQPRRPGSRQRQQVQQEQPADGEGCAEPGGQPSPQGKAPVAMLQPPQEQQQHGDGDACLAPPQQGEAQAAPTWPSQQRHERQVTAEAGIQPPPEPSVQTAAGGVLVPPSQQQQPAGVGISQQQQPQQEGEAPPGTGSPPSESGGGEQQAQQAAPVQEERLAATSSGRAAGAAQPLPVKQSNEQLPGSIGSGAARRDATVPPSPEAPQALPEGVGSGAVQQAVNSQAQDDQEGENAGPGQPPTGAGMPDTEQPQEQRWGAPRLWRRQSTTVQSSAPPGASVSAQPDAAQPGRAKPPSSQQTMLLVHQQPAEGGASAAREQLQHLAESGLEPAQPHRAVGVDYSTYINENLGGAVAMDVADALLDDLGFCGAAEGGRGPLQRVPENGVGSVLLQSGGAGLDYSSYVKSLGSAVAMDVSDALLDEIDF